MGSPKPNPNVNAALQANLGQQRAFQDAAMGGLTGAQSRSDQAYNAAFGGYQNLLQGLQNPQTGGGGGGANAAQAAALAAIHGLKGPSMSNPWAGQLGQDIRERGESLLPAFYDRIKEEQTRLQNVQGGYNPGFTSQMAKLAREQAQGAQSGQLSREIELGKLIDQRNRQNQAAQQSFQMNQAGMLAGLARGGRGGGGGGPDDNFRQQMAVLGAMGGLRGQAPGETGQYLQGGLGGLQAGQGMAGQYAQYNPATVPGWQRALGAIGGVAGGLFGAGGAFAPGGAFASQQPRG